jgi:hypothetical protein
MLGRTLPLPRPWLPKAKVRARRFAIGFLQFLAPPALWLGLWAAHDWFGVSWEMLLALLALAVVGWLAQQVSSLRSVMLGGERKRIYRAMNGKRHEPQHGIPGKLYPRGEPHPIEHQVGPHDQVVFDAFHNFPEKLHFQLGRHTRWVLEETDELLGGDRPVVRAYRVYYGSQLMGTMTVIPHLAGLPGREGAVISLDLEDFDMVSWSWAHDFLHTLAWLLTGDWERAEKAATEVMLPHLWELNQRKFFNYWTLGGAGMSERFEFEISGKFKPLLGDLPPRW